MDIWRLIDRDHANISQLIREIPNALNGPGVVRSRERLLSDLLDELHLHAVAVDASLMTALGRHPETRRMIDDLRREHRQVADRLGALADGAPSAGWLNAFEDATYLLDRHLHHHVHELLPLARALLTAQEVRAAATAYVRARERALRAAGRTPRGVLRGPAGSSELALTAVVGLAAVGAGFLAWRFGLLRGAPEPVRGGPSHGRDARDAEDDLRRGQPRSDLAAASAPGPRVPGEDLRQRQERLLDEAVEETFPASDPIAPHQITR